MISEQHDFTARNICREWIYFPELGKRDERWFENLSAHRKDLQGAARDVLNCQSPALEGNAMYDIKENTKTNNAQTQPNYLKMLHQTRAGVLTYLFCEIKI